jgi:hypothetical protein
VGKNGRLQFLEHEILIKKLGLLVFLLFFLQKEVVVTGGGGSSE